MEQDLHDKTEKDSKIEQSVTSHRYKLAVWMEGIIWGGEENIPPYLKRNL